MKIPNHRQASMVNMFITRDAKLWWIILIEDDENVGHPKI